MAILLPWIACACATAVPPRADNEESGSGSRHFRDQAIQSIPIHQLNQSTKDKIDDILRRPSLYRRLPITTIATDPDHFRFLVRYPEVIVNIWQLMGVTQMTTKRTGPFTMDTDDGAGTISSLELLYGNENIHIFYGTGTYEGPVIRKKLSGRCVLILRTDYSTDVLGHPQATNQLDVFLKVDNATLGLVAKTIQPMVGPTADQNFTESLKFVQRLNETTENNGPGVQQMGTRLEIDDDVRQKYIEVAGLVYERALQLAEKPIQVPTASSPHSRNESSELNYAYPTSQYRSPESISPAAYRQFSDQRFSSRPAGYQAPRYDPVKRY